MFLFSRTFLDLLGVNGSAPRMRKYMEVIRISPRGYCYGVVDALQTVRQVAKDPTHPRPIYIIGQIVHNRHAIEELTNLGVITLDGPDRVSILDQRVYLARFQVTLAW